MSGRREGEKESYLLDRASSGAPLRDILSSQGREERWKRGEKGGPKERRRGEKPRGKRQGSLTDFLYTRQLDSLFLRFNFHIADGKRAAQKD